MPVPGGVELWGAVGLDGTYFPMVTDEYKRYYAHLTRALTVDSDPVGVPFDVRRVV